MFSISFAFINFLYQLSLAGGGGSGGGGGGGGGSGGGGSSSGGDVELTPEIAWIIFLIFAALVTKSIVKGSIKRYKKNQKQYQIDMAVFMSSQVDGAWSKDYIINSAMSIFYQYQKDWEEMNFESMKLYMTEEYFNHVSLMLGVLAQMGRVNQVREITIDEASINGVIDAADNNMDALCIEFDFSARDILVQDGNRQLYNTKVTTIEYWHFARIGDQWKLAAITQATEDPSKLHAKIRAFTHQNGMYYSPDYGRLLLPERGQLFSGSSFLRSDINNHVVGVWSGNHLVQLYTYAEEADDVDYIIAQINLPKSYGGIIVQRKGSFFSNKPKDYVDVSLEWGDFNERYQVFATHADQVTSFELLNPAFMAWLYDRNIKVDIEVVDNVVYLYSKVSENENRYPAMMEILKRSYKELKL